MAGIFGGTGILGGQQNGGWGSTLGILGAGLADAGANFSGHPADANNLAPLLQRQQQMQQTQALMAAVNSPDPNVRQQAYSIMPMLGMDPSAFQKAQASQALPKLMDFMQPQEGVKVTPEMGAMGPGDSVAARTASGAYDGMLPGQSLPQALQSVGSPELTSQMAPEIIKQQLADQDKHKRPATAAELKAANLSPDTSAQVDNFGNISVLHQSDVPSQGKLAADLYLKNNDPSLGISRQRLALDTAKAKADNPYLFGGAPTAQGPDALNSAPPATQAMVRAMLEGRQAPPTSFALKTPYWQNMLSLANAADPTFDQTQWGARASARKDMLGGGKSYQTLNSGNTAIQHLGHLNDQINTVSGVALPLIGDSINAGINKWNAPQGNLNPYNDTLGHLAEETTKFYRGTGGNEQDITRNMSNLSPDLSTQAKKNGVANTVSLIYGKLAPMVEQYNKTMGTNYPASHFLSAKAVATVKKMGFDPDSGDKVAAPAQNGGWSIKVKGQ